MLLIVFAVAALLTGALLSLFFESNRGRILASLISQAVAVVLIVWAVAPVLDSGIKLKGFIEWSFPIGKINLSLDALSAFFLLFSVPMTFIGSLFATGYLAPHFEARRDAGVHFALLNMTALSFVIIYLVENAIAFLLGWEMAALSAWLLVIFEYRNQKVRFAGFNYLISTHVGLLFLVAAFMLLHAVTGSFDLTEFKSFLHEPGIYRNVVFILFITSFSLKSAFYPFHTWLPRAHAAAPAHVSALMSGVIHKAGLYGMLRFILLIERPEEWMGWYLIGLSCLSAFMGALYTLTQRDLKRLLGYSSTENVGIAGIALGLGVLGICWQSTWLVVIGFTGAVLHVLNHALFKCLLFYGAGCIYRMVHTVDAERLGGLIKKMPQTAFLFLIGGLAISGMPVLNGFVSEWLIFSGLLKGAGINPMANMTLIFVAALLSLIGCISAVAVVRSFGVTFLGHARDPGLVPDGEPPGIMRIAMALHAVGILTLGLFPTLGLRLVKNVTGQFLNLIPSVSPQILTEVDRMLMPVTTWGLLLTALTAAFWSAKKWWVGGFRQHVTWACGYHGPNFRMQYSASSFSDPLLNIFRVLLGKLTRAELPSGFFPLSADLVTYYADTVERRLLKALGEGEDVIESVAKRIREETQASFAIGLVVVLIGVALILMRNRLV